MNKIVERARETASVISDESLDWIDPIGIGGRSELAALLFDLADYAEKLEGAIREAHCLVEPFVKALHPFDSSAIPVLDARNVLRKALEEGERDADT